MARSVRAASALLTLAVLCFASSAMAQGGVFIQELPIYPTPQAYTYNLLNPPANLGPGGLLYTGKSTLANVTTPQAIFQISPCGVLTHHIHPRGTEQLFIYQGSAQVGLYLEDGSYQTLQAQQNQVVVIPAGAVHYVQNAGASDLKFFQTFDNPNPGTIFLAKAVLSASTALLSKEFVGASFPGNVMASTPVITLPGCSR